MERPGSNGSCPGCRLEGGPAAGAATGLAAVLIFTIVVDVLGNALVILSVLRNKKLRNAGNIFVVSLSVADLVVAVYPYPLILSAIFHNGWTMGNVHCQISGFLMGLSVIGSIFNITAIAINRYCYICHSLRTTPGFTPAPLPRRLRSNSQQVFEPNQVQRGPKQASCESPCYTW
ncbi:PREDICTED: melatonin-related receptor isoform X6 [Lepidothrix coronata]|uniref:Melatonin-related receptor isoform X6 n=1 Tax=Lepidothrix coronata TaxID=321398 RepID=A0A6J0HD82_9PASS|nr:PREDICTED: melatonin-related receptor isoform X6 [Lepidothrix coronata]